MTDNIRAMSTGSNGGVSDDTLVHRLYDLAFTSQCDPRELAMIDFLVYSRLAETYGGPPPAAPDDGRLLAA